MLYDSHVHSTMSTDSKMSAPIAIEAAGKQGLGMIFTEHYDADYAINPTDFRVDPKVYLPAYEKYRSKDVLLGIEIGVTHFSLEENRALAEGYDFDFVLASVHMVGPTDIFSAFVYGDGEGITCESYLRYALRMVEENDFYDALAHVDYPHRYAEAKGLDFSYKTHSLLYDALFKALVERGKLLELNTRRLDTPEHLQELLQLYSRYGQLGGKYITIGSDAHRPENVGLHFKEALAVAEAAGLTPVVFKERKLHHAL